jgi:hypothetical protein
MDPGKSHFAWSILTHSGKVLDTGMIKNVIQDMSYLVFIAMIKNFSNEVASIICRKDINITHLAIERLTPRPGMGSGATAEYVNVMIGIVYMTAKKHGVHRFFAVMPSTWKQWLSRAVFGKPAMFDASPQAFGFNQVVKNEKKSNPFPIKEHQFDSIGLGLWSVIKVNCPINVKTHANEHVFIKECTNSLKPLWEIKDSEMQRQISRSSKRVRRSRR